MSQFKDHFSGHADRYADYRPKYPDDLFAKLASLCDVHKLAWDCATGNGQAAVSTAKYFDKVIATDASAKQIASAPMNARIDFRVAVAESSGLDDESVDLITVAQALHWFDIEAFFAEANRVLKPGGILAVWTYEHCQVEHGCDEIIRQIFDSVEDYWPPERALVLNHYAQIDFPLNNVEVDQFLMTAHWTANQMLGYMRTWSASQRFIQSKGVDPTVVFGRDLSAAWDQQARQVSWPMTLKIGRK